MTLELVVGHTKLQAWVWCPGDAKCYFAAGPSQPTVGFWASLGAANVTAVPFSTYGLSSVRFPFEVIPEYLKLRSESCNLTEMLWQGCGLVISGICEASRCGATNISECLRSSESVFGSAEMPSLTMGERDVLWLVEGSGQEWPICEQCFCVFLRSYSWKCGPLCTSVLLIRGLTGLASDFCPLWKQSSFLQTNTCTFFLQSLKIHHVSLFGLSLPEILVPKSLPNRGHWLDSAAS